MNFRKASIFQRDTEKPEEQNDSGGMLAVWGSPGSGKTITAVKIAKMLSARKKNVILLLCDMAAPMLPCICPVDALESNGSLAGVLAAARISENLIKHNLVIDCSRYLYFGCNGHLFHKCTPFIDVSLEIVYNNH